MLEKKFYSRLTKAMKSFQKSVDEFINSKDQPTLTRQRKANQMMEWSNKLEKRLENLTNCMEDFTDFCMSLGEETSRNQLPQAQ